ncbi:MAG: 3-methyl-2-oxobutanoate dehydrogenase subunit VorB [Spirochaeta sp. LUC14_002_19_P3]|nr:MAG: 3-methyl-2-oxobutanoate dehydrogenase subunit VorB [Spirochaeta sp. LUC14_002_19_P3]
MTEYKLMKGNEAMAEAALIAGCRYYYAYPITPQNEVVAYMAKNMPRVNGTFIQAESELAAASMVMGSAASGGRAMTSSSSPGITLKQESISYMAGAELPCVIANIMRGGPGLGGIAGAQGDYFQATRGGGHGDYRTIVLAPDNAQELADFTVEAFDLADEYRTPVIILADGYLGQMSEPVVLPKPTGKTFEKPWAVTGAKDRKQNIIVSLLLHPENVLELHNLHLQEKYERITQKIRRYETYKTEDADWLLAAYGTSARIAQKAVDKLREDGIKAGLFRPTCLWPFPDRELAECASHCTRLLTVEMSHGQMVEDVKLAVNGAIEVDFYGRAGGALPTVKDIIARIKNYEHSEFTHVQAS